MVIIAALVFAAQAVWHLGNHQPDMAAVCAAVAILFGKEAV